ncbi:MAG: prephenate dehydratase [Actinomycetota bacterium]|nr:prephenate dehydratase [Actinomycetota bacterium]
MRVGYFGPEGTFTHEAVLASAPTLGSPHGQEAQLVPLPTIHDTVMAVHEGTVQRALVPIENSVEGAVNATLDALAIETEDVAIVGEVVYPISQCLIARSSLELSEIEVVASHPQATGQCTRFLRTSLPDARVMAASSTAEAVRIVAGHDGPWGALGNRLAAELYGCDVLLTGVQDEPDNETRFVWLGHVAEPGAAGARGAPGASRAVWKTAIVFWGPGAEAPGWLVACLSELASREVNLTRIQSRPRKQGLGRYMFFADLEGAASDAHVAAALEGLRGHVEVLRVLGSFPLS